MSLRTIYYRANLFDQTGMASLLPPEPPPPVPKQDKRELPPPIRQEIVNLHAQYPAFRPHELATCCLSNNLVHGHFGGLLPARLVYTVD
jgi:hypothetical protein